MALPAVPEWLKQREGSLKPGLRENVVLVMLANQPQYRIEARPAGGSYACVVAQSNNGKRLDGGAAFPSAEAAFQGGLEDLRKALGW